METKYLQIGFLLVGSFYDSLLRWARTFRILDVVSVNDDVDLAHLHTKISRREVDFVIGHCHTYACYKTVKKVKHACSAIVLYTRVGCTSRLCSCSFFIQKNQLVNRVCHG